MSIAIPDHVAKFPAGPSKLTSAFLRANIVNFNPRNLEEAEAIQKALLARGLIWLTGEREVQRVATCVARGLHVDKGRLVTGNDRREEYVDATFEDLQQARLVHVKASPRAAPVKKIDPSFFEGRRIVFVPKAVQEAIFIQESLFLLGFSWSFHGRNVVLLEECVSKGMLVNEGRIYTNPVKHAENIYADIRDLPGYDPAAWQIISPQQKLQAQVEALTAEVAALKAAVAQLTAAAGPHRILKPTAAAKIKRPPVR